MQKMCFAKTNPVENKMGLENFENFSNSQGVFDDFKDMF